MKTWFLAEAEADVEKKDELESLQKGAKPA